MSEAVNNGTGVDVAPPSLIPLILHMEGCATQEEMNANVAETVKRGFTGVFDLFNSHKGEVSIVGSGPSIQETYKDLKGDIWAINQAIGWLLDKGIVPKWAMIWDAAEVCEQFAIPHPEITYLVAARCHPKVFERLKDCNVRVWFPDGDHNIRDYMVERKIVEPLIKGGSAGVTRAMYFAPLFGYTKLHLFGADSCYSNGKTHVIESLVREKDIVVWVGNGEGRRAFRTTPEWASQVNEFRDIYHLFTHPSFNVGVETYGDGMLQYMGAIMKMRKDAGKLWKPDGSPFNPGEDVAKSFSLKDMGYKASEVSQDELQSTVKNLCN